MMGGTSWLDFLVGGGGEGLLREGVAGIDGLAGGNGIAAGGDVVDAEDFCLMECGPDGNSHGGIQSVVHGAVQKPVQKSLPGVADAEWPPQAF